MGWVYYYILIIRKFQMESFSEVNYPHLWVEIICTEHFRTWHLFSSGLIFLEESPSELVLQILSSPLIMWHRHQHAEAHLLCCGEFQGIVNDYSWRGKLGKHWLWKLILFCCRSALLCYSVFVHEKCHLPVLEGLWAYSRRSALKHCLKAQHWTLNNQEGRSD